ncbi:hypothetical protein G5B30_02420 [Sphingobacterium sp. SGG-5]|uniref:hypothetical protein n=1 Tax=Sphingobacterium sp. SGG-5 TaxID=2710881 RepID=UPI0013E9C4E9|nr:hypothetical protein [Sphingobacterium sp. SGG-5]NGM60764.1 hypothetical protein [Sphingobacterium sp. SGG-5]
MRRPTTQFKNLDAAQLIQFAEDIAENIATNSDIFETPTPDLATLTAAITVFRNSVTAALFNDRLAISARNEKRAELENVIYELSKYVDTIAKGNETLILSAGFTPSKEPVFDTERNPKANHLRVEPDGLGTLRVQAKVTPWKKARYYQFEYRKKGVDTAWERILSTKAVLEIDNLEAFQEYEFRVTYLGRDTVPNYSDVISTFAL